MISSVATVIPLWQSRGTCSAVCKVSVTGRRQHPSALPVTINKRSIMHTLLSHCYHDTAVRWTEASFYPETLLSDAAGVNRSSLWQGIQISEKTLKESVSTCNQVNLLLSFLLYPVEHKYFSYFRHNNAALTPRTDMNSSA